MKDHPGIEAALEITEAGLDQLADNQFLADIPVVGVAFKVCKLYSGIRERIYISKLTGFLTRLDSIPQEQQRDDLGGAGRHRRAPEGRRATVDGSRTAYRPRQPAIMAVFLIAYLRRMIDLPILLRCWDAIETAYGGDLKILLGVAGEPAFGGGNSHLEYLVRSGLTTPKKSKLIGDDKIEYFVSGFGNLFINVYHEANAA